MSVGGVQVPARGSWSLLVRHAERGAIPSGSFGDDVPLTTRGRTQARALGVALGSRLGRVVTSPVPRCVETADGIIEGAANARSVETDVRLGAPGVWVVDARALGDVFLTEGPRAVVRRQLAGPIAGLRDLRVGAGLLLDLVARGPTRDELVDVFVSHDAVIAPFLGYLLEATDTDSLWPDFIEGVWFQRNTPTPSLHWRGTTRRLPEHLLHGP